MTHLSEIIARELAALRIRLNRTALTIVETGTIRGLEDVYRDDDGWSTLTFAEQVKQHGGQVYSIDLDISVAARVLARHNLDGHVHLIRGYSVDVLAGMVADERIDGWEADVVFLDSDNDPRLILHEYLIARRLMHYPGLVMVDDVDMESTEVLKGHLIVPWLNERGIPYRIEKRHGPNIRTGVLLLQT